MKLKIKQNYFKYSNNTINIIDVSTSFTQKKDLEFSVEILKKQIIQFTNNNKDHSLFNLWNNYYNQLNSLNLDDISVSIK
jgi:mRNA-degrading endonuclease YafQ of YafQ-DinJ toxin-antitoxin module